MNQKVICHWCLVPPLLHALISISQIERKRERKIGLNKNGTKTRESKMQNLNRNPENTPPVVKSATQPPRSPPTKSSTLTPMRRWKRRTTSHNANARTRYQQGRRSVHAPTFAGRREPRCQRRSRRIAATKALRRENREHERIEFGTVRKEEGKRKRRNKATGSDRSSDPLQSCRPVIPAPIRSGRLRSVRSVGWVVCRTLGPGD